MGMYDEVGVCCPNCGTLFMFQSKCGPCGLNRYTLTTAPLGVLADIASIKELVCSECDIGFEVKVRVQTEVVAKEEENWREL